MMKFSLSFLITIVLSVGACFAQNIYMELTQGTGGATPYTGGEILISSISYGFANTVSGTGGAQVGKLTFDPVVITKQLDPSTAAVQPTLFRGAHYQRVRFNFYRPINGGRELAYQVVLGDVTISNYKAGAAEGCTSGCPLINETIALQYVQVVTREFSGGSPVRTSTWNLSTNSATVDSFLLATN